MLLLLPFIFNELQFYVFYIFVTEFTLTLSGNGLLFMQSYLNWLVGSLMADGWWLMMMMVVLLNRSLWRKMLNGKKAVRYAYLHFTLKNQKKTRRRSVNITSNNTDHAHIKNVSHTISTDLPAELRPLMCNMFWWVIRFSSESWGKIKNVSSPMNACDTFTDFDTHRWDSSSHNGKLSEFYQVCA